MENKGSDNILLSFCIPTYNRCEWVSKLVEEILVAVLGEEIEVIVSDDISTDATERTLREIKDPRFHYFRNAEHLGFINTVEMFRHAKGKWCMQLGDKDELLQFDWNYISEVLRTAKNIGIIRGNYFDYGKNLLAGAPSKIMVPRLAETYLDIKIGCSYSTCVIIDRQILLDSLDRIDKTADKTTTIWTIYPHLLIYVYCVEKGALAPLPNLHIKRRPNPEETEIFQPVKEWHGTADEPYWTINSRLRQNLEWINFFRTVSMNLDERLKLLNLIVEEQLGRIINYYEWIMSPGMLQTSQYKNCPAVVDRDRSLTAAQWHERFWEGYLSLTKEILTRHGGISLVNEYSLNTAWTYYHALIQRLQAHGLA